MACFDQNIVIDLEFTATPKALWATGLRYEVIEIGAVRVLPGGVIADEFRTYVRPDYTPHVHRKVTQLTGISDETLQGAPRFAQALEALTAWIGPAHTRMVAWSDADFLQLKHECACKLLPHPSMLGHWMDLQQVYPRMMNIGHGGKMALRVAADWYGTGLDTTSAHQALYDAQVTAELLRQLMTGEYREQRRALSTIKTAASQPKSFSSSLGSRCSNQLAALLAQMTAAPEPSPILATA